MNLSAWLQELKRRRVFRALVAYGLGAFALLQVVEPVMHGLELPDWVLKVVVIGLGVGLPITIVLAWAYDVKPGGIERTRPVAGTADGRGAARAWRTLALVAIGLLLASPVVTYYLVYRDRAPGRAAVAPSPAGSAAAAPSVAVLPFVNMSGDPGNEYFSDGLSEEILNELARIPGLHVPARTSSFAFKGRAEDVGRIGAALRVATLLEGSVRREGGRVRITAQLVNAADGFHLWSQTFDRELKDVFAIQDEIAGAIASALKLKLAPAAGASAAQARATTSTDAYEAYLLGRHALNQRTRASIEASIASFQRATVLDPRFAPAYADLAIATLLLGRGAATYGDVPMKEAIARARPLVERALTLAPERPEVLAAAGFMEASSGHMQQALDLYDRSLGINPSNGELQNWRKIALEALGRYDQILAAASDAVKLDPLSKIALYNYAPMLQTFGRTAELDGVVERLRSLDEGWGQWVLGSLAVGRGDRARAVRHLLQAVQLGRDKAGQELAVVLAELGLRQEALRVGGPGNLKVLLQLGDFTGALDLARSAARQDPSDTEISAALFGALYGAGRLVEAEPLAARLWETGQAGAGFHPELLILMADSARAAGRADRASLYRDKAQRIIELCRRSGIVSEQLDLQRSLLALYDGRNDEAVGLLAANLVAVGGPRSNFDLHIASGLSGRADFQAVLGRFDAILADQRLQVLQMLCGPDRLSPTWKPAPGTCALPTAAP